jgi:hypothetical protein
VCKGTIVGNSRIKINKQFAWTAALTVLMGFYTNCTGTKFNSESPSVHQNPSNGGGIDGKVKYINYGVCDVSQPVQVKGIVLVSSDYSVATAMRENCQDLSSPQPVSVSDLEFAIRKADTFAKSGQVFDLQTGAAGQKVTVALCQSASVSATVWKNADGSGSYFGQVILPNGSTTGAVAVQNPATPGNYQSAASGTNSFQLNVNNGALTYALADGVPVSATLNCGTQAPPPAPVTNLMVNAGFENGFTNWETFWGNNATVTAGVYMGTTSARAGKNNGGVYQDVTSKIVLGTTYTLSFAAKTGSLSDTSSEIGVECMAPGSNVLFDKHIVASSTTWQTHSFTFSCPAGSTEILVYVWKSNGSSYVYADDFFLSL